MILYKQHKAMASLGLQRGIVRLVSYDPEWQQLFEVEKNALESVLGDSLIAVEHIGSTAVPGIKAKPILDLMVAIKSLDAWERIREPLSTLGYEFRTDFRKEHGHILFVKGPEECRTHYLKVTECNSDFWTEHVLFRDYLISHPEYRDEYQRIKESLLEAYGGDRAPYTKGKEVFVKRVLNLAGFQKKES
jgi:GrpB-like predicted nucleotidyltransferase (UPF0157 family)